MCTGVLVPCGKKAEILTVSGPIFPEGGRVIARAYRIGARVGVCTGRAGRKRGRRLARGGPSRKYNKVVHTARCPVQDWTQSKRHALKVKRVIDVVQIRMCFFYFM